MPAAKWTVPQLMEMAFLYGTGWTLDELGDKYGVSKDSINMAFKYHHGGFQAGGGRPLRLKKAQLAATVQRAAATRGVTPAVVIKRAIDILSADQTLLDNVLDDGSATPRPALVYDTLVQRFAAAVA